MILLLVQLAYWEREFANGSEPRGRGEGLVRRTSDRRLSWRRGKKAAVVDIVMNAVSTTVGTVLIPVLGLVWEIVPGAVLCKVFSLETFNPGTWAATFAMAVFATTAIEAAVVNWGFKIQLDRRRFWILCGANGLSVSVALASLWMHPTKW